MAGIINIITKKDIDQGYNGSINGRYSNLFGTGTNLNLTVKQGKLGVGGYFGYTQQNTLTTGFRNLNDIFGQSLLMQSGSRTNTGRNMYSSAELSYEVDTLNLFTASFEQYSGGNDFNNSQLSQQTSAVALNNRSYQSANGGKNNYSGFGLGTNYQLGFKRDKEQLLTASYKYNQSGGKLFNDINFLNRANFNNPNYKQYNNSGSNEHTLQLDYVHPVKKWLIEAGTKAIFRKNYSNYNTDTLQAGAGKYVTDQNQTNDFDYLQNVYSLYNSYQLKLTKWVLKGGMRLERTTINAYGSAQVQPYSNLVPSFSVQRSFTSSSLNLGYTDRIQRPGISELNPFYDRSNINFRNIGNPNLRPVVSHNVELNYSNFKKGSLNIGLNYRFANNTIESVVSSSGADAVSITTYQNVGKNKGLGIDVNVSYPITSKFNVNMNAEIVTRMA